MDILHLLGRLWRHWLLTSIVFLLVIAGGVAVVLTTPAVYQSTAAVTVTPDVRSGQIGSFNGLIERLLPTLAQIAGGPEALNAAAANAPAERPVDVRADAIQGTLLIRIQVRHRDPDAAAGWANALTQVLPRFNPNPTLAVLQDAELARPDSRPVSPNPKVILPLAAILGLACAVAASIGADAVQAGRARKRETGQTRIRLRR